MRRVSVVTFAFLAAIGQAQACNLDAENETVSRIYGSLALDEQTEKVLAQEMMGIAMQIHAAANAGDMTTACEMAYDLQDYLNTFPKK